MRQLSLSLSFSLPGIVLCVYIVGLNTDVIEVDAAQYASISMEMLQNKSFLQITERGINYLDKPPFLFWINALSFQLFGFNNFAYKLPTLLFSILGLVYTFKLGRDLYSPEVGRNAAIVLATSLGFVWTNNDVKTDALVMSAIVMSVYFLIQYLDRKSFKHLILASVMLSIGMMTKGPMGFIFPCTIVGTHLIVKRKWEQLFYPTHLLVPIVLLICLLPMCYGLYHQFDLQPEKIVNGKVGVSGLRFFFWEQSFGRITGENVWENNTTYLYLFHALFLLFLPYSFIMIYTYLNRAKKIYKDRVVREAITFLGPLIVLLALSFSSYKIPHYALVVFPFVAIACGYELSKLEMSRPKWMKYHNLFLLILSLLLGVISLLIFEFSIFFLTILLFLSGIAFYFFKNENSSKQLFTIAILLAFIFNAQIVPNLLTYSEGRQFAALIQEKGIDESPIYFFNRDSRAIEFYLKKRISVVDIPTIQQKERNNENAWYFMSNDGKEAMERSNLMIESQHFILMKGLNRIDFKFLNPQTRAESLDTLFLVNFANEN